jgi:mRNA-degrading endonuclease RelE of RelBE toxin-antitoxin system
MKVEIDNRLRKDLKNIKDRELKLEVLAAVEEMEAVKILSEIVDMKFMIGYQGFFRIRIGDYRLGCRLLADGRVSVIRFLHRAHIYSVFP